MTDPTVPLPPIEAYNALTLNTLPDAEHALAVARADGLIGEDDFERRVSVLRSVRRFLESAMEDFANEG